MVTISTHFVGGLASRSPQSDARPQAGVASKPDPAQIAERQHEQLCLAQAVYYEARGESLAGQEAVAQVILNRVHAPGFPKTVCQVVYEGAERRAGCQFSFVCDGSMKAAVALGAWTRAETVAEQALSGFVFRRIGFATYYHTRRVAPSWSRHMKQLAEIGAHIFYAQRGAIAASAAG